MSISAQLAAQELRKLFVDLLPDRHNRTRLASDLSRRLCSLQFPATPRNFEDACVLFHELFAEISHPDIVGYGYSRRPILYGNVLFAIRKYGVRLKVFRSILIRTCEEHCQYEALFAVMCDALHHQVGYYDRFNSQNCRDFLLKGMMMVRIEQRRRFPPGPNCELTYLFHFSLDDMLEMMKRKHGMSGHEDTRRQMKRRLESYNTYQNEKYSEPIRRLLQEKPNFFSDFKSDLEILSRFIIREAIKERFWLDLMHTMTFKLYEALSNSNIVHEYKTWIIYWYIRHHHSQPIQSHESFNDMMTRIVQTGQMAFPFREHPRLFKSNDMVFKAALKWDSVPTSDLNEICFRSHVKSQYGPVPSQRVLAALIRRKLYKVKTTEAAAKIQKMARRSLWQFYLKRLIAAMFIKKRVLQIVTPILHVKHSKILIISAVKRIFIQEKFFERLECYRYIQQIKAGCLIFKVLNRHNHVLKYQKIRAGSIIQSRLIAIFERQKANAKIELLKAASTLSRFTKVQRAAIVHKRLQKIYARSIIQFRLIALFERQKANAKIERLKAASTLSRFAKVQCAAIVHKRFQNFFKNLSCYECPTCLNGFESAEIDMIQPCGHIHCKDCFTKIGKIVKTCSICRAQFMIGNCKSVETFLSQPNSKFFFTSENPEKKAAIEVITKWWIIKRRLLAETRTASLRMKIARKKLQSLGLVEQSNDA
jgi:hypothetical protein